MADNSKRGFSAMDESDQKEISRKGGESSGDSKREGSSRGTSKRGLASADKETRQRVAREGGKASHGGGRRSNSSRS
ncbi:MAG TPA: KGG domain-containing protein [Chitinophagaceae bacterium]